MAAKIFRANSKMKKLLDPRALALVEHIATAIQRLLPHVEVVEWQEGGWNKPGARWANNRRTEIKFVISLGERNEPNSRSLTARVRRQRPSLGNMERGTLDAREYDICTRIADRLNDIGHDLHGNALSEISDTTLAALGASFDEATIAQHIQDYHSLETEVAPILIALHTLAEQTYENRSIAFGCILSSLHSGFDGEPTFPQPFLSSKKYKALSDGYRTAYKVSSNGHVIDFLDLETVQAPTLTARHFFPEWSGPLAAACGADGCALALTRQGDILVFDGGTLRFTYRYGRWQYWNHSYVIHLLKERARAQRVPRKIVGNVIGAIYRAALDVSFRRSGALFVVLHSHQSLHQIVRQGEAIGDIGRSRTDQGFDDVVRKKTIQSLPRSVIVELASLDGAVVLANSGEILAYGAILQPKRAGRTQGAEGSRTKAAIGASIYGLTIKVSSDGDITIYHNGTSFFAF